jgi:glycosyltransferase involved in cell wall biosynthesis
VKNLDKNLSNIISVCIVVQNNHGYIRKLLNSMYNLYKLDKIEIIIVDNNSIDNSSKEIDSFKDKLNLVCITRKNNIHFLKIGICV